VFGSNSQDAYYEAVLGGVEIDRKIKRSHERLEKEMPLTDHARTNSDRISAIAMEVQSLLKQAEREGEDGLVDQAQATMAKVQRKLVFSAMGLIINIPPLPLFSNARNAQSLRFGCSRLLGMFPSLGQAHATRHIGSQLVTHFCHILTFMWYSS
jgi:hypothetical protein